MTRCHCPPRMCYFRPDCRKIARGFKPPPGPQPIGAILLRWLEDRHDELTAELQGELRPAERKSKAQALLMIDTAIARHAQTR